MDAERIKSILGICTIFMEEATEFSAEDYQQLQLRLRDKKRGHNEMILCYNPVSMANWVYKNFHSGRELENTVVVKTTYRDNKFLPKEFIQQMEELKISNYSQWLIYSEGKFATLGKLIFEDVVVEDFNTLDLRKQGLRAYMGLDFGWFIRQAQVKESELTNVRCA